MSLLPPPNMETWQYHQRSHSTGAESIPSSLMPPPELVYTRSFEGSATILSHDQAGPATRFPINALPLFSHTQVTAINPSTFSFSNAPTFSPYSPIYSADGSNLPTSHNNARIALTGPRTLGTRQEIQVQPRNDPLDWNARYPDIKRFHENGGLEATRQKMLETFGFDASIKQYKEKFAEWRLWKNLSVAKARWMLAKAEKRKREGKETVFLDGYKQCSLDRAEKTVKRSKSRRNVPFQEDAPTPVGMAYHTPRDMVPSPPINVPSPTNNASPQLQFTRPSRWTPMPTSTVQNLEENPLQPLRLTWNGHTRVQLTAMSQQAYELERLGQIEMAESRFRTALDGLQNLLAPTHEETNKVAYQLVSFYAQHDRMDDADTVLGWMCDKHIERWGFVHKKTVDHLLHILELFSRWSRVDDAITLISRAFEAFESSNIYNSATNTRTARNTTTPWNRPLYNMLHRPQTISTTRAFDATDEPVTMDYQIGLAKASEDEAAESLLLGLISQCNKHLDKLTTQLLEAWHALITLYQKLKDTEKASEALQQAEADFQKASDLDLKWSGPQLDAAVELAKLLVKDGQYESADSILLKVEAAAEVLYGEDDDKTIRLLIRIGIFFQDQQRWNDARPRFEHALAASMTWSGVDNDRTKRLQAALDNEHYEMEVRTSQNIESILRRDWPDENDRHSTHHRNPNLR